MQRTSDSVKKFKKRSISSLGLFIEENHRECRQYVAYIKVPRCVSLGPHRHKKTCNDVVSAYATIMGTGAVFGE
jgi:hypothetical protein